MRAWLRAVGWTRRAGAAYGRVSKQRVETVAAGARGPLPLTRALLCKAGRRGAAPGSLFKRFVQKRNGDSGQLLGPQLGHQEPTRRGLPISRPCFRAAPDRRGRKTSAAVPPVAPHFSAHNMDPHLTVRLWSRALAPLPHLHHLGTLGFIEPVLLSPPQGLCTSSSLCLEPHDQSASVSEKTLLHLLSTLPVTALLEVDTHWNPLINI